MAEAGRPHVFGQIPHVAPNTLGRLVVNLDIKADVEEPTLMRIAEEVESGSRTPSKQFEESRQNFFVRQEIIDAKLADIQSQIAELDPGQAAILDAYCENSSLFPALSQAKNQTLPDGTWTEWLAAAEKPHMLSFLHWHVRNIERLGFEPEVIAKVAEEKQGYKTGIRNAVADGWVHPDVLARIDEIDGVKVYAGDVFDTDFQKRIGYYTRGGQYVVIGKGSVPNREQVYEGLQISLGIASKHEFDHVMGMLGERWLDEAVTEHVAHSLDTAGPRLSILTNA